MCAHNQLLHGVDRVVSTFQCASYTGVTGVASGHASTRKAQAAFQDTGWTKSACSPSQRNQFRFLTSTGRWGTPMPENQEGAATLTEPPQPSSGRPHHCPQRLRQPRNEGGGGSLPSSPECPGGIDLVGQSTVSESDGDHRHRRHCRPERRLALAWLNLPVFRSMNANVGVPYEIW